MSISVLISTYGDEKWSDLAQSRALPSAEHEQPDQIVLVHQLNGTVSSARNEAAEKARGEWLCFLDADDELGDGFVTEMKRMLGRTESAQRLLFTPAISYVKNGRPNPPRFWPEVSLKRHNWLVIGTLIQRTFFWQIGAFKDYGDPPGSNAYEDWALWARASTYGAQIVKVPRAVYIVHVDMASRHRGASRQITQGWHLEIGKDLFPEVYANGWPLSAAERRRVR